MQAERLAEVLEQKSLAHGSHTPDGIMCVMEAASYIAGEPWSDAPQCVCPSIRNFMLAWNDGLPNDAGRDRLLKPLLPLIIGTRSTAEVETKRRWMAFDWLVREHCSTWMDLTGNLKPHADALRGLPEINAESIDLAMPVLQEARKASAAARDAVGDAARDAVGDAVGAAARAAAMAAAWDAARAAAWDAAWAAAWDAARAAAWDAAWAAAWDAAWDAAMDAAWAAAWDAARAAARAAAMAAAMAAAWDAARDAAWAAAWDAAWAAARAAARDVARDAAGAAAWAAAWAAAGEKLNPTVKHLQDSAQDLIRRMCAA